MKNKQLYCNVCDRMTSHRFIGTQRGIPGKTLDLYDCLECNDTCGRWIDDNDFFEIPDNSRLAEQFKKNHPHLYHWLDTGLGKEYLRRQLDERR